MADREYKYSKALEVDTSFRGLASTVQNDAIRDVAKTYVSNIERILSMGKIPLMLAVMVDRADEMTSFAIKSIQETAEQPYPPEPKCPVKPEPKLPAKQEHPDDAIERQRRNDEKEKDYQYDLRYYQDKVRYRQNDIDRIENAKKMTKEIQQTIDARSRLYTYGLGPSDGIINQILGLQDAVEREDFARGLEATLSGIVIGAWTAFEAMTGDLWEDSLNAYPRLGFVALDAEIDPNDDDAVRDKKRKVKYQLPVRLIRKWNYDPKNKMGSLLRGKWDFARRNEAKDAYLKVFGKKHEVNIKPIFDDRRLKWIAALRNVIVHNAGIADHEFVTLASDHPTLCAYNERDSIFIDGELVRELVNATIERAVELIGAVGGWLTEEGS